MSATDQQTTTRMTFAAAQDAAIARAMRSDPRVFVMGTAPPPGLVAEFGPERVRRMPISEALFTGMAVGAAPSGWRPVVLWRNATFSFVAFDQVVNQAAKLRYMTGGQRAFPITFSCYGGAGMRLAAQHSQSPYAMFAQVPGVSVVAPTDPQTAFTSLLGAIEEDGPSVFFGASRLDNIEGDVDVDAQAAPPGRAIVRRHGDDVTVVAVSGAIVAVEGALEQLAGDGVSVDFVDLQSVVPLDVDAIRQSVRRTGRLLVVDEAPARCSVAAEVITSATEHAQTFAALRCPPARVCGADTPIPFAAELEDEVVPDANDVVDALQAVLAA